MVLNETKNIIDMQKFIAILELCLSEKQFELNPKRIFGQKVNPKIDPVERILAEVPEGLFCGNGSDHLIRRRVAL